MVYMKRGGDLMPSNEYDLYWRKYMLAGGINMKKPLFLIQKSNICKKAHSQLVQ